MFTQIYLLPQFDGSKKQKYKYRWNDDEGKSLRDKILKMIRDGAGEDFLMGDFQNGELGFLEDEWDLKGLNIFKEDITFPGGDSFEAIDFSYSDFYHSKFNNACFQCNFSFTNIYNCEFNNCTFAFNSFYASKLEKTKFIECIFIESNSYTNCKLSEVEFNSCFFEKNIFFDCEFDVMTNINGPLKKPFNMSNFEFDFKESAEFFKGIKEAYANGSVTNKYIKYYFKQKQSVTRYNSTKLEKLFGYFLENIAGYGVKPFRVFETMIFIFLLSYLFFSQIIGFSDSLILTSGAFFTFGANNSLLENFGIFYKLVYVLTSFFGISLIALMITVFANLWFSEK